MTPLKDMPVDSIRNKPWLGAVAAAAAVAVLAALGIVDSDTAIGFAIGGGLFAAYHAVRNSPSRVEPFQGDGYAVSWVNDDLHSALHVKIDLDDGAYCSMLSRAGGAAGSAKLSNYGSWSGGDLALSRGLGENRQRINRRSGGTVAVASRSGTHGVALEVGGEQLRLDVPPKTPLTNAVEQARAASADLDGDLRALVIAYVASQQYVWLPKSR